MDLKLLAFRTLKHDDLLDPAHTSLSFILHQAILCPFSCVELDCHLLAKALICAASSCNHLVSAAAEAHCCQNLSLLLCSRACYCCSLLVFPGKDNVQPDMSVTFNKNKSRRCGCSSGRLSLARGFVIFLQIYN